MYRRFSAMAVLSMMSGVGPLDVGAEEAGSGSPCKRAMKWSRSDLESK